MNIALHTVQRIDVKTYLKNRRGQLKSRVDIIKDYSIFDFNHIPEQPVLRSELRNVIDAILLYAHTGIPKNVAIIGSRGSGKTLGVRFLAQEIQSEEDITILYCNIRNHNTSFKALASLVGAHARGKSLDELFNIFKKRYPKKTVVVLDEIDLISPKDRHMEILYRLSRSRNNYMVIVLSNNPRALRAIDESTRSTLQPETVYFKNYDATQIYDILKARAIQGLKTHKHEDLRRIAALTTRETNSDVRVAIKSLFYTATDPDVSAQKAFERACRDVVADVIQDLNDKCLLILESARRTKTGFVKDIYQCYKRLSEAVGETPFSYMHFYNNLSYLQSCGLLLLVSTKVGRTYTNRIRTFYDPDVQAEIYENRFG